MRIQRDVMHTEESEFYNFMIEELTEIQTELENTVHQPVYWGHGWVRIKNKIGGRYFCDTFPSRNCF